MTRSELFAESSVRVWNRNARNLGAIALVSPVTGLVLTVDTKTL